MMTLYMYWPQVVWAVLVLLGLGIELARYGQARTGMSSANRLSIAMARRLSAAMALSVQPLKRPGC